MLEGPNINLRIIEQEDIPLYQKWINTPEIRGMYNANTFSQISKDLLKNAFSGNIRGTGPGTIEFKF